jgi:hypothetical protein
MLDADLRVVGHDPIPSMVGEVADADAILCRTNAEVLRNLFAELEAGRRVAIVGGSDEIKSFARAAERLQNGQRVEHVELACFDSWDEVQDYVRTDANGSDLALMVKLIDEFGTPYILETLDRVLDTRKGAKHGRDYDVAVSTAHKAKGREWDRVRLASDFPEEPKGAEELRLLYVAVTRAKLALDIAAVALLSVEGMAEAVRVNPPTTAPAPASEAPAASEAPSPGIADLFAREAELVAELEAVRSRIATARALEFAPGFDPAPAPTTPAPAPAFVDDGKPF